MPSKWKFWKAKFRSVPSAESLHNHERQEWVFQAIKNPKPKPKTNNNNKKTLQTKHAYIHKRAQEFSMGVGSNNREVMTLGWRLEPEQLGYCMETADFCTGSNHCWLGTPNPYLYFFLSPFFFFRTQGKAPWGCSETRRTPPGLLQPGACVTGGGDTAARDPEGPCCSWALLPGNTGLKGTGST